MQHPFAVFQAKGASLNLKKWSGRVDLPAPSEERGTTDLLVPNQIPNLIEIYGFLLFLTAFCRIGWALSVEAVESCCFWGNPRLQNYLQ